MFLCGFLAAVSRPLLAHCFSLCDLRLFVNKRMLLSIWQALAVQRPMLGRPSRCGSSCTICCPPQNPSDFLRVDFFGDKGMICGFMRLCVWIAESMDCKWLRSSPGNTMIDSVLSCDAGLEHTNLCRDLRTLLVYLCAPASASRTRTRRSTAPPVALPKKGLEPHQHPNMGGWELIGWMRAGQGIH